MRRAITILSIIMILVNFLPQNKVDAAAPVIRFVAGSTAEKVLIGIGEKAGVHFATKTAQQKAFQRWNYDLDWLYKQQDDVIRARMAQFENAVRNVKPIPVDNRPGWSKVIVSGAAFAFGADLIFEGYHAFKSAYENSQYAEVFEESMRKGNAYTSGFGLEWGSIAHTDCCVQVALESKTVPNEFVAVHDMVQKGTDQKFFRVDDFSSKYVYVTVFVNGVYINGSSRVTFERSGRIQTDGAHELESGIGMVYPEISDLPSVNVPTPLREIEMPGIQPVPEKIPNEIEILIPDADWMPSPEPVNPPLGDTEPAPNPNPDPPSLPGTDPIEQESPPEDTKPPSEDGCERPWDFKNFKTLGSTVSTKFPFSIPWDVYRAFYAVFGGMESSEGKWTLTLGASTNNPATIDIKIPDFFDGWKKFIHTALLITFDIGLIYAIRKWFGGAA